jgi:O-antigen ligase
MYLEPDQIFQLIGALIGALIVFVAANSAPLKVSVGILLVFIPFQPIDTRFGSANVVMTYVIFGALLLRGRIRYLPIPLAMLAVIFAYLLSISQLDRALYVDHGLQLMFLVSGFLILILTYNLARELKDPRFLINLFIGVNVLVLVYCLVQLTIVGPGERLYFFGNENLWMHRNRGGGDPRLVGPFGTPGLTAAYLMSMTVILVYEILHSRGWRRILLLGVVLANLGMMIATGNRGSFLVLLVSMLWFLYMFRRELGFVRIVQVLTASAVVLAGAAFAIVNFTDFNVLFERLERTEMVEGGIPDTRRNVWPRAWVAFEEKPLLGHGPNLAQERIFRYRNVHPDQLILSYPHNLYLHLLVTVGVVGTLAFLAFFAVVVIRVLRGSSSGEFPSEYERGLVRVGLIVIVGFLVDQLKIEFLRSGTVDYAHFVFALFGLFIGWADQARARTRVTRGQTEELGYSQHKSFAQS